MAVASSCGAIAATGGDYGLKLALAVGFAVVFGLTVLLPWTMDLWLHRKVPSESKGPSTVESPEKAGTPGLSRASMPMSIIVVIGFALVHLLVVNPAGDQERLAPDIIVALTTTLAAIVAFYFGNKIAQESAEQASKPKEPEATPKVTPTPTMEGKPPVEEHVRAVFDEAVTRR